MEQQFLLMKSEPPRARAEKERVFHQDYLPPFSDGGMAGKELMGEDEGRRFH